MYQALYRKYRPLYFNDMVGQDVIVKTLKQSIINGNFGHAYLFYGSRGTGKTSLSKIFARSVNCLSPKYGEACGKCDNCKASFDKECVDILEMDAASNNGVDEIRRIIDTINLAPNTLTYKVYIIDEVHMLSSGAFNALLKTLEEPPSHVIFILATTELQKVPSTIVSRCQVFSFKRLSTSVISSKLGEICKKEKIKIDDNVLYNIALYSNGGMRDSLSTLDKLRSYAGNKITMEDFLEVNEAISQEDIIKLCDLVFSGKTSEVLSIIDNYDNMGKNLVLIVNQIIDYLRSIISDYYLNNTTLKYDLATIINFNILFIKKMFDIKKADNPRLFVEMLFIKFMSDNSRETITPSSTKVENPNDKVVTDNKEVKKEAKEEKKEEIEETKVVEKEIVSKESTKKTKKAIVDKKILNIDDIMNARFINTLITSKKSIKNDEIKKFDKLKNMSFDIKEGFFANNLLDGVVRCVNDECVVISFEHDAIVRQNLIDISKMNAFYKKATGSDKKLCLISDERWNEESNRFVEAFKHKKVDDLYKHLNEPEPVFEEAEKDDIISDSAIDLFDSDIVEMD